MQKVNNRKFEFNTNTIYSEMAALLFGRGDFFGGFYFPSYYPADSYTEEEVNSYYNLEVSEKIDLVNKSLKHFLISKLAFVAGLKNLQDKTILELVQLIYDHCNNPMDVWNITHYIVGIIGEINGPAFIISAMKDEKLKDKPDIDFDKKEVTFHVDGSPVESFKYIYEYLFTEEYMTKGISKLAMTD